MAHSPNHPPTGLITAGLVLVCVLLQSVPPSLPLTAPTPPSLIAQNYSRVARHSYQPAVAAHAVNTTSSPCGGTYRNAINSLTSPNYPANYPPSLHCVYVLRSPVRCATDFHVQFVDFDLPATVGCVGDHLQIDGTPALCGRVIGSRKYRTADGVLRLVLQSDGEVESTGFELRIVRSPCAGADSETKASPDRETADRKKRVLNVDGEDIVHPIYVRPLQWRTDADATSTTTTSTTAAPQLQFVAANLTNSRQYLSPSVVDSSGYQPYPPGSCWGTNNGYRPPAFPQPGQYPSYNPPQAAYYPPGGWQQPAAGPAQTPAYIPAYPTYNPTHTNPPNSPNWPLQPSYPQYPSYSATNPSINPIEANQPGNSQCIPFCLPPTQSAQPGYTPPQQPPSVPRIEHQAQIYPNTLPRCCTRTLNQRRFYLASSDFPSRNPLTATTNRDCVYHIERAHPSVCRLRIEFRYFHVGSFDPRLGGCQPAGSYMDIDGRRVCGCNTGLRYVSQWGLGTKVIRLRQLGAAAASAVPPHVRGFWLDVVQEDCPHRITEPAIGRRSDGQQPLALVEQQRLHSSVTHTNSSSVTTYFYYGDGAAESSINRDTETKEAFDKRTETPASSQFFVLDSLRPSRDRCSFAYGDYLRLAADPLWQLRPRCGI